jgi:putative ABC transport system permease protein
VSPLLLRASARYHRRHPLQLALAVLGITLGVAVVVSVDVANTSARRAFLLATEAVTGRASHEIVGGPAGVPETLYATLRLDLRVDSAAPVIDRYVRLQTRAGADRVLRMLGIDPFAERPFRPYVAPSAGQLDVGALLAHRALLLAAGTAADLGLHAGDTVFVSAGSVTTAAMIGGVLEPDDGPAGHALEDVLLTDIATAQELAGIRGVLDRIELRVAPDSAGTRRLQAVESALPPALRLLETGVRTGATVRMARAFETNLLALSLVALVFGMFLIYNSVTFSLVQRRGLIGLLRAQGVTAREVFALVMLEALAVGTAATLLGMIGGAVLGRELVRLVATTINDLYFTVNVTGARVEGLTIAKAAVLGTGATLLAAFAPAREAVRTPPRAVLARSVLERGTRRSARTLAAAGAIATVTAAALLLTPSDSQIVGFAALFVLILAAALLTPAATITLMRLVRPLAWRLGPVPHLAARGVTAALSRTAPAIAALSVAIAVGMSVTIMIGSFRTGVIRWLEQSLQADIYVSAPDLGGNRTDVTLDPRLPARVAGLDGVAGVTTYRHAALLAGGDFVRLIAVDLHTAHTDAFAFLDAPADVAWREFRRGGVLVSEPLAFRRGLGAGDTLVLPTNRGDAGFRIAAVYRDYASEHGIIFIDRAAYQRSWDDRATTSLGIFLRPGVNSDAVLRRIRALPGAEGVVTRSNLALRESTLVVFDRTFLITGVLRLLALLVAFVGVTGALMALQLERTRETGILRATGLTPAQVWALVGTQTGLMGLTAAVLALPLGWVMAWAMVNVINRRAFGWSFDLLVSATPFVQALVVGTGAALLAGLYPAFRMTRLRPADALRGE